MSSTVLESQKIGLWGIVFAITGFVIGVSIFILPSQLIEITGPAVILAYALAGAMALLNCFAAAESVPSLATV